MIISEKILANCGKHLVILTIITSFPFILSAQPEKKFIRQGNREYEKNKYSESEISYRKAADINKTFSDAVFNTGDALYKQKKYDDAAKQFTENSSMNEKTDKKASAFYNLGNSLLMANKLKESIEAYENSLKLEPGNMEAKYNLAYAQDLLKKQQQQQQQQQNNDKNKDQDKKDQNKDQKQNNKDQDKKQDNQNQQNNKDQQQQQQQQQQDQQQSQSISKEDAERLLNSIANDEKNVQEKVKLAKASKSKVRTLKNW